MKKIIYFFGYSKKKTRLINFLKKKNFEIKTLYNKRLTHKIARRADLIISFGYRKLIPKKIINSTKRPIINLHISYLPYNKGAHPNFWSFVDNTPKGVTIHEINKNIDDGPIIFRKKITFSNLENQTLETTHSFLIKEIENLFIKNFSIILKKKYKKKNLKSKGTIHYKKDFPKKIKSWKIKINNLKQIL